MDEHQWIHSIQKGNKQHLQDIAEKYYDDVYRFCAFWTGSRQDAYDLAQETFLRFIRYIESYREHNLKGYLLAIAMNACRTHLAQVQREQSKSCSLEESWMSDSQTDVLKQHTHCAPGSPDQTQPESTAPRDSSQPLLFSGSTPEDAALSRDIHARLMNALAELPEVQRESILLHYMHDLKYREIAKLTDTSVSTVKSRVRQGMAHLQTLLKKEDFLD